jgi:alkylation response protein AidB-like acyl-CoA dehydrogenase
MTTLSPTHRASLEALARQADEQPRWPADSWHIAREIGATRWAIPVTLGGDGLSGAPLLTRYEDLAGACLTTCFILSQRDAACRRLLHHAGDDIKRELLTALASGDRFATVGLAQLTTSRQHTKPAVTARLEGDDWRLDGLIPWVTGAPQANHVIVGAVTDDNKQILAVLPTDRPGVHIGPPLELMALRGALTAEIRLDAVRLPARWLLAGPTEQVLRGSGGGTGGLETSCLALGLTAAALRHLESEAGARPELSALSRRLTSVYDSLRSELYSLVDNATPEAAQTLRARANALVLRVTQAALAASKGTGFLKDHPAQRWARQAMFFLVWSCPWPVTAATMADLNAGCAEP